MLGSLDPNSSNPVLPLPTPMKTTSFLPCFLPVATCAAQLYSGSGDWQITGNPSAGPQIVERVRSEHIQGVDFDRYLVTTSLVFTDANGQFLRPDTVRFVFDPGIEIGPSAPVYLDQPVVSPARVRLVSYYWQVNYPGNHLSAEPSRDYFQNQARIFVGFSRLYQGGWHYGWVHMEREVTRVEDMLLSTGETKDYIFRPKGFAVHPIPDRPIRAGMEPDLPVLSTELTTLEGGGQGIRVSWPTGWPGMVLEYASDLSPSMEWRPVEGVVGSGALMELPEDGQLFFRLRYAP